MRFSAYLDWASPWPELLDLARHLKATGWDGVWLSDHLQPHQAAGLSHHAAWTSLAALAASVPRIRLGVLVSANTFRHPAVLAKMAAQVDIISGGRVTLGLGAAWQEDEHRAYGLPFHTMGERLRRLEEACQVIRSLFANERTTFHGRYYRLTDAPLRPKPIQRPGPPLLIGGGGERVTLRIAARYADAWNVAGTPAVLARKLALLDRHCAALGRNPAEIARSAYATLALPDDGVPVTGRPVPRSPVIVRDAETLQRIVQEYTTLGLDELMVSPLHLADIRRQREGYDRFQRTVVRSFR